MIASLLATGRGHRVVDDQGTAVGQRVPCLGDQFASTFAALAVEDVAERDHVGAGKCCFEKVAPDEAEPVVESERLDVVDENRLDVREVESRAAQVGVSECDAHRQRALGASHVDEALEALPREAGRQQGDLTGGDSRHSGQERLQCVRVGIERGEELVLSAFFLRRGNTRLQKAVQPPMYVDFSRSRNRDARAEFE